MSEFCPDEGDLPEGWALSALPDVVDINPPKPKPDALPAAAPVTFLPMAAVSEEGTVTDPQTRAFAEVRKGYTAFADGDVILAKITPCFENGKAALVARLTNGLGFGSSEFHVLRSLGGLLPKFVFHYFHQPAFRQDAAESMSGTAGQARVTTDYMRGLSIPHPPLAEQRRIVEKVEALLAQVNAARARLAKVPTILKRFRQSILSASCSGHIGGSIDGDSWPSVSVGDACAEICDCPHSTPKWSDTGEVCLRTTNFTTQGLDLSEFRRVGLTTYSERTKRIEPLPGDVVYSREGGILGIACIIPPGLKACLGQRMMLMRPDPDRLVSRYLELFLNSPETLERVRELTGGTAAPHLNVGDVKEFELRLPPLPEQHEIVHRVDALFKLANAIEARVAAATARADKITQAILAKAFRGELVPTEAELARQEGRDYEPATALLARIRAARATNEDGRPTRRPRADTGATSLSTAKPARRRTSGRTA